jgi:hypothetical protein
MGAVLLVFVLLRKLEYLNLYEGIALINQRVKHLSVTKIPRGEQFREEKPDLGPRRTVSTQESHPAQERKKRREIMAHSVD